MLASRIDWYRDDSRRAELEKALASNPIFQEAISVLKDEGVKIASKVVAVAIPEPGALAEYTLQRQAYTAGYFGFLEDLLKLTRPQPKRKPDSPVEPWGHIKNETDKE